MKKKLIIIGRGTAGSQAVAHYLRWLHNYEIEWHYDPAILPQAVGEGSTLQLPKAMFYNLDFTYNKIAEVTDGTFKAGILKQNWGEHGGTFFHPFPPPNVGLHFNAVKLQNYVQEYVKGKVKIVESHIFNHDSLDCDYIMDCSGKPKSYDDYDINPYIPVNAVHVNQCQWEYPRFEYTLTIARPYGWVFGIPLQNRCSIGYLYNKQINTLDEIKEDILNVITEYNLKPSDKTNSFEFGNYTRKTNFSKRVIYNGNASFFLEPLEATSFATMNEIMGMATDIWNGLLEIEIANKRYKEWCNQVTNVIMMHYFAGSIYNTDFWSMAKNRADLCMTTAKKDKLFKFMCTSHKNVVGRNLQELWSSHEGSYGNWPMGSFACNIRGLNLVQSFNTLFD